MLVLCFFTISTYALSAMEAFSPFHAMHDSVITVGITYVHRRLWPALVKLASRFREEQLAKVWNEHTASGAHQSKPKPFPTWVPSEVMKEANAMSVAEAESILSQWLELTRSV